MRLRVGDHVYVWRTRSRDGYPLPIPYQHHGIYAGRRRVIHLCGEPGAGRFDAEVRYDRIETFSRGCPVKVVQHHERGSGKESVRRAAARLGERRYHLRHHNCEHFATECCTGEAASSQVQAAETALATLALLVVGLGGIVGATRIRAREA